MKMPWYANLSATRLLSNLNIGRKLTLGFGILVSLTLLLVLLTYGAGTAATVRINQTDEVRVPTSIAASRAEANLLKMLSDVHVYLTLGDPQYRTSYAQHRTAFETDLDDLEALSPELGSLNSYRLEQLQAAFNQWVVLPDQLFELRDDQLEREPAYRLLVTEGLRYGGTVLIDLNTMIEEQGQRDPSERNVSQLADMANMQGSFGAMLSGLRGYVTTRNRAFRGEYEANLALNQFAWERLVAQRAYLTEGQQAMLDEVSQNRDAFLALPEQMFTTLESDRWREDLYLFRTEAVPVADTMLGLLTDMAMNQQEQLRTDLALGRQDLARANQQTLGVGVTALLLAMALALIIRENIAGPVRRLTQVAEQIGGGDLAVNAKVESEDEIGKLATTFNNMTHQLRRTLSQVRKEKRRADDLLNVVIPIGVDLSSEKDFNRLLEKMLVEAKTFCHAASGILYLRTQEDELKHMIVRDDTTGQALGGSATRAASLAPLALYEPDGQPNDRLVAVHVALSGDTLNLNDIEAADNFDFSLHGDPAMPSNTCTLLGLPLRNSAGEVLGVLQLTNARDPESGEVIAFDVNLQQMMESFSSLAVAALEAYVREQRLRQEIQQLRIEIDEAKREAHVSAIVDSDYFQGLQTRVRNLRKRNRSAEPEPSDEPNLP